MQSFSDPKRIPHPAAKPDQKLALSAPARRKRADRRTGAMPRQRLDTRLMASATVGVCLGSLCGISLMIVAAKGLNGRVDDLDAWLAESSRFMGMTDLEKVEPMGVMTATTAAQTGGEQ